MKTITEIVSIEDPETGRLSAGRVERQVLEPSDVTDFLENADLAGKAAGVVAGVIEDKEKGWGGIYQAAVAAITQLTSNQAEMIRNQQTMIAALTEVTTAQATAIENLAAELEEIQAQQAILIDLLVPEEA